MLKEFQVVFSSQFLFFAYDITARQIHGGLVPN